MNMKFELAKKDNWSYYRFPELEAEGVVHGFFTRASPSLEPYGKDGRAFLDAFALRRFVAMKQEHGDAIHVIRDGEKAASGDGIIVIEKNVAGVIKTADCLPVIIAAPGLPMAAIVHAGWRGTAVKITGKAVQKMAELGAAREGLVVLMGPSIGPCCYEVKEDVASIFLKKGFTERVFHKAGEATYLDIREANRELLRREGVTKIYDAGLCTYCSDGLFASYRRGEKGSRQINFVSLRG
ncbi:MAG TPA: peptidoglycan editing factor PgeF [Syntrophorhabdaceae bacterium]|nr:peptidoglycan editing factor PgeF [Syntrophorhabdaceae bacterium]HQM80216.1 peptidoglycan editing factor PgeF [Syntrophorhabdaceae bacterium]